MQFDDTDDDYVTLAPLRKPTPVDEAPAETREELAVRAPKGELIHPGDADPGELQSDIDWIVSPHATEGWRGWVHHHTGLPLRPDRRERKSRERYLHLYRQAHETDTER